MSKDMHSASLRGSPAAREVLTRALRSLTEFAGYDDEGREILSDYLLAALDCEGYSVRRRGPDFMADALASTASPAKPVSSNKGGESEP